MPPTSALFLGDVFPSTVEGQGPCFAPLVDMVFFAQAHASKKSRAKRKQNPYEKKKSAWAKVVPSQWLFSDESGRIRRKTSPSLFQLRERFLKLNRGKSIVCSATMRDGSQHNLDRKAFETLMTKPAALKSVSMLRPAVDSISARICEASVSFGEVEVISFKIVRGHGEFPRETLENDARAFISFLRPFDQPLGQMKIYFQEFGFGWKIVDLHASTKENAIDEEEECFRAQEITTDDHLEAKMQTTQSTPELLHVPTANKNNQEGDDDDDPSIKKSSVTVKRMQKEFAKAMNEKDDEIARLSLELDSLQHQILAAAAVSEGDDTRENELKDVKAKATAYSEEIKSLNDELQKMKFKSHQLSDELFNAKEQAISRAQVSSNVDLSSLQKEMDMLEAEKVKLEDRVHDQEHELEIKSEREKQLRQGLEDVESEKESLQQRLAEISQDFKSISRIGTAEDAAIAAVRATADAKVAKMQNELVFAKRKAETEADFVTELQGTIKSLRDKITASETVRQNEIQHLKAQHKMELRSQEEAFEKDLQVPKSQISLLEGKVATLQSSLEKAGNGMAMTSRKLQVSEHENCRLQQELARRREENEALERNLLEMQATLSQMSAPSEDDETKGEEEDELVIANEMRRLENEIEYLNQQLLVEMKEKAEIRLAVDQSKQRLENIVSDWKADVAAREAKSKIEIDKLSKELSSSKDDLLKARAEAKSNASKLLQLQSKQVEVKDQLKINQVELKKSASRITELSEEISRLRRRNSSISFALEASRSEAAKTIAALEEDVNGLSTELETLKKTHASEIAEAHLVTSDAKASLVELRCSLEETKVDAWRAQGAIRIAAVGSRITKLQMKDAFQNWKTSTSESRLRFGFTQARDTFQRVHEKGLELALQKREGEVRNELREAHEIELREAKERVLKEMRSKLDAIVEEGNSKLQETQREFHERLHRALREQDEKQLVELRQIQERADRKVTGLRAALRGSLKTVLRDLQISKDKEISVLLAQQRDELLLQGAEKMENMIKLVRREMDATHDELLKRTKFDLLAEKQREFDLLQHQAEKSRKVLRADLNSKRLEEIVKLEEAFRTSIARAVSRAKREVAERYARHENHQANLFAREVEDIKLAFAEEQSQLKASIEDDHHKEIRSIKAQFQAEMNQTTNVLSESRKVAEAKMMEEHSEKIAKLEGDFKKAKSEALKLNTEKWQAVLKQCSEQAIADQNLLLQKAEKAKKAAVEEKGHKIRAEFEEREKSLSRQQKAALANFNIEGAERIQQLRVELEQKLASEVEQVKRIQHESWTSKFADQKAAHERKMEVLKSSHVSELHSLAEKMAEEKISALNICAREAAKKTAKRIKDLKKSHEEKLDLLRQELENQQRESEEEILDQCNEVMEKKMADAQMRMQQAVIKSREQSEAQFKVELSQIQSEHDAVLSEAQIALEEVTHERNAGIDDANAARTELEKVHQKVFGLQKSCTELKNFNRFVVTKSRLTIAKLIAGFVGVRKNIERKARASRLEQETLHQKEIGKLESSLQAAKSSSAGILQMKQSLQSTIQSFKRDEITRHRETTKGIQNELQKSRKQKEGFEMARNTLKEKIRNVENDIRIVEGQLEQLSKVSAIQDGKVNMNHAKHKRKLDADFEQLLENASIFRKEIDQIDLKIEVVVNQCKSKEVQLRQMERELLQILVQMQKKVASIVS